MSSTDAAKRGFLSTELPGLAQKRLALSVALVSVAVFLGVAPYARVQLPEIWAFVPIYQSALIVNELITAALLFGQYCFVRSKPLLVLASAYLFSASMAIAHALSFPGLFSPAGLLGGGAQTTAWLYFLWHAGFPLFLIAYARPQGTPVVRHSRLMRRLLPIAFGSGSVVLAVLATAAVSVWHDQLPVIMQGQRDAPNKLIVAAATWAVCLLALFVLWRRKSRSILDLWCLVVVCVWLCDIGLAAVLNGGRFDLGFYAGRVYGLLAGTFVLIVLLVEHGMLYARLMVTQKKERHERRLAERRSEALVTVTRDLDAFTYSVSHDLRAPLRAIAGFAGILDHHHASELKADARALPTRIQRAARRLEQMTDELLAFSHLGRQPLRTQPVDLDALVSEVVGELVTPASKTHIELCVDRLGNASGDPGLLKHVWTNLLSNAIKYSRNQPSPRIEMGVFAPASPDEPPTYYVKDNGVGFDMRYADRLFGVFQRLHTDKEFEGHGVGLALVRRIVLRHGGRIWAQAAPG